MSVKSVFLALLEMVLIISVTFESFIYLNLSQREIKNINMIITHLYLYYLCFTYFGKYFFSRWLMIDVMIVSTLLIMFPKLFFTENVEPNQFLIAFTIFSTIFLLIQIIKGFKRLFFPSNIYKIQRETNKKSNDQIVKEKLDRYNF